MITERRGLGKRFVKVLCVASGGLRSGGVIVLAAIGKVMDKALLLYDLMGDGLIQQVNVKVYLRNIIVRYKIFICEISNDICHEVLFIPLYVSLLNFALALTYLLAAKYSGKCITGIIVMWSFRSLCLISHVANAYHYELH